MVLDERSEWLEADGLGGFASGTATGVRTRRYHALLLAAATPPTGRIVLVNGLDCWVTTDQGEFALSTQRYAPGVLHPDGHTRLDAFVNDPWPTWQFVTSGGVRLVQELAVEHGTGRTAIVWTLVAADQPVTLTARPFLSGRDYHALHHENGSFRFAAAVGDARVTWRPYDGVPPVTALSNGRYTHEPLWYRNFLYAIERERGLDDTEDLASPGSLSWRLEAPGSMAALVLSADTGDPATTTAEDAMRCALDILARERARRGRFATQLERAADAYVVRRGSGRTIVAGYPWFTDWGRDTFIAIRGMCIATRRLAEARSILLEWAGAVSRGMLPNRFADAGEAPEFNAVDASLWYAVAVRDLLVAAKTQRGLLSGIDRRRLRAAVLEILDGYTAGTRYGIRADADGLLAAGVPEVQLTWMDARVGDRVITPRVGKPVEVQALWINALKIGRHFDSRWDAPYRRALHSFRERFWNAERSWLYDVVDVDHVRGTADPTLRPNQILAIGGLPLQLLPRVRARAVVDAVERELVTPVGLRSLARGEDGYCARYEGGPGERDGAYHQGSAWPWLIGAFVEAWVRVRGNTAAARDAARTRFLDPLLHLAEQNGGHVAEIADGEAPFTMKGCPFQAWSVGEILRLDCRVLDKLGNKPVGRHVPCSSL